MNGKLGRETKIGLAVLAALGLLLVVVLVQRLTRGGESAQAATDPAEKGPSSAPAENFDKELKKPDLFAVRPTLLSPSKDSKRPDALGQWSVASDSAKKSSDHSKAEPPPAYPAHVALPEPPHKATNDRYATSGRDAATDALAGFAAAQSKTTRVEVTPATEEAKPAMASAQDSRFGATPINEAPAPLADSTTGTATAMAAGYQDGGRTTGTPAATIAPARTSLGPSLALPPVDRGVGGGYGNPSPYSNAAPTYPAANPTRQVEPAPTIGGGELRRPDGTYEVQPNENFWLISEKLYGTGMYFKALAQSNRGKIPSADQLHAGMLITAPSAKELEQAYPDLCPKATRRDAAMRHRTASATPVGLSGSGRTYVVQEGDTLFDIARNELGKASRWAEIYALNREVLGKDYHYLTPGMQLAMPSKEVRDSGDRTARQPNGGMQR